MQVSVVGIIRAVETSTTKVSFIIDDHTATIEAINYVGTDGVLNLITKKSIS